MLLKAAIVCCLIAITVTADDHKTKKKDPRGKRNLEYNLSHHHYQNPSYRSERRISLGPYITRYPSFFPGRQNYRKGRPQSLPAPPYAVQMEPLVQYSQRDPLYDPNLIHVPPVNQNGLAKSEDLTADNNRVSENVYGPPKHVIERPIYIKEPEPIIEIIIKESNVTLPPIEVPQVTPAPRKKEQVQVFYVKYKKNPYGKGKDSIIYEKPIPAISPPIKDEEPIHHEEYRQPEFITSAPPPSTTLRAIIKPDSETFHANKGIHITFGKEHEVNDDLNEESAPEPAVSLPQGREFNGHPSSQNRPESLRQEIPRISQPYRPFNRPPHPSAPTANFPQFGRKIPTRNSPPPPPFASRHPPPPPPGRGVPTSFLHFSKPSFNQPPPHIPVTFRQPVPYQTFDQIRPQDQIQFPRGHTHFPVRQQLPANEPPTSFNPHQIQSKPAFNQAGFNQHVQHQEELKQPPVLSQPSVQLVPSVQPHQQFQQVPNQEEIFRQQQLQEQVRQHEQIKQQQLQLQLQHQKNQQLTQGNHQQQFPPASFVPPGGELIQSVPKYEQHYAVGANGQLQSQNSQLQSQNPQRQSQNPQQLQLQQIGQNRPFLNQDQFKQQVQQQFKQPLVLKSESSGIQNAQKHSSVEIQKSTQPEEFEVLRQQNSQLEQVQRQNQQIEQIQRQNEQQIAQLQRQNQLQQYQQQYRQQSPVYVNTTPPPSTTTPPVSTTERKPETTTKDPKELNLKLPDEVPDDLRQHLLSSGILNNADISVLDYDKVGDIPLSALPPDQLANFYGAGGAQQIASGSAPVPSIVKPDSARDLDVAASENVDSKSGNVEMKVVHYDPESDEGKKLQDSYVKEDATQVDPVELNDTSYNRYLPLKVSGAQFPIPDIEELKGKKINSVVVLAPVDYKFQENVRVTREADNNFDGIAFPKGSPLKELIENPSRENYIKFLESENKTSTDQQSVILLVTGSPDEPKENREIFMYDVATQTVSKLSGELSSAFVDAAEANTSDTTIAASNLVEVRVPSPENVDVDRLDEVSSDLDDSPSDIIESKVRIIDPMDSEVEPEASEQLEHFVDISGRDLDPSDERNVGENEVEDDIRSL